MRTFASRFIKFAGMAGILALSVSTLQAENSGFYGAVGFQYSNMTKATGSNGAPIATQMANPFLNLGANSTAVVPVPNMGTLTTPNNAATMNVPSISQPTNP
ncbi:hypothetical protein [Helicobacter vulpis]|uniref:hypothetical protein n=1 Tax=Helicobacter vulpis TaxID=2316076 RepID=UPI001968B77B|nr:hypothetical protein [Helicobacter vulpis]